MFFTQYHTTPDSVSTEPFVTTSQSTYIMPEPITPPSTDILALPQEDHIQLAISAINEAGKNANGKSLLSVCKAASIYDVPCSTLGDHIKGLPTHAKAHADQ